MYICMSHEVVQTRWWCIDTAGRGRFKCPYFTSVEWGSIVAATVINATAGSTELGACCLSHSQWWIISAMRIWITMLQHLLCPNWGCTHGRVWDCMSQDHEQIHECATKWARTMNKHTSVARTVHEWTSVRLNEPAPWTNTRTWV